MMPIKFPQTKEQQIEVMLWVAGTGPVTAAVRDAWTRNGLTFGAALITRRYSDGYARN